MRLEGGYLKSDFMGGQVNNVNPNLVPRNAVELGINVDFDEEIGSAVSRLGTAIVGAQLVDNMSILGLHQHIDTTSSSNNKLFATVNATGGATSVIYDVVAGTTSVTGLTASKKMRFLSFLNATLAINGTDAERSYTAGGGWITTAGAFDLDNVPGSNTCELVAEFLDRVYLAGDSTYPSRLYFSGLSNGTQISWTDGNGYVDIEAEDAGGPITALAKVPAYLLVFKERSLHRFNYSSAFPEALVQIGTPSQESVVVGGGLCAFYSNSNENTKGFYITNGDRPQPISHDNNRPIKKWVDAITSDTSVAGFATDRGFKWSIGDVTVDGETWTNVWLCYNRILNQWSVRSYPTEFKVFANYLVSGVNTIVGGDDDGTIYRVDKAGTYSDNGTAIQWRIRDQWQDFGFNQLKDISNQIYVRGKNTEGTSIRVYRDEDVSDFITVGTPTLAKRLLSYVGIGTTIRGTSFSVELAGTTTAARAYIRELEIPTVDVQQSYYQ